jgi:benzoate membrane transport protein
LRLIVLERTARPRPGLGEILGGLRGHHLANAIVSFLFACTGPVSLILAVGIAGGLKAQEIASWISIAFGLGGIATLVMSLLYRQPLAMAWTIPGTAIVGTALLKYPYPEIVGAYVVTGGLMLLLGLSGGFKLLMNWMPQPIVMAMVAGLFLKFGLLAIDGFDKAPIVASAAAAGFLLFSLVGPLGRVIPPVVAALAAGAGALVFVGGFALRAADAGVFADLLYFEPKFSEAALLDLVLPLAISVVVLQNAQGIGILRLARHDPPPNTITAVCGVGTVVFGLFGSVCMCLTGPANAILSSSGPAQKHYLAALIWAGLAVVFGVFAPAVTNLALAVPDSFIYVIGGLAMLRVLQQSLSSAFNGKFAAGAVVCFTVTVTELIPEARFALFGVGAPVWGLVFGIATSLLMEPGDFARRAKVPPQTELPQEEPPQGEPPQRQPPQAEPAKAQPQPAQAASEAPAGEEEAGKPRHPPVPAWALEPPVVPKIEFASKRRASRRATADEPKPPPPVPRR